MKRPDDLSSHEPKEDPRKEAWLTVGGSGHSRGEYMINFEDLGIKGDIPESFARALKLSLGEEWFVHNRGDRIEIMNNVRLNERDDAKILAALDEVLGHKYKIANRCSPELREG